MLIVDILITVMPLLSYYSQYALMLQNKSVGTFSIYICGILIVANTLRIFFWFVTVFGDNLLIQSFLIIGIQFLILDLCIKLGYKQKSQLNQQSFWRWDTLNKFIIFSVGFAIVIGLLTLIFGYFLKVSLYGTILGLVSLSIQSTLAFPQLIANQKNRSVQGLSIFMIVTWFMGDFFKTIYFVVQDQPFQFIICGAIQLTVDTLILIQIMAFKDTPNKFYANVKQPNNNDHQNDYQIEQYSRHENMSQNIRQQQQYITTGQKKLKDQDEMDVHGI